MHMFKGVWRERLGDGPAWAKARAAPAGGAGAGAGGRMTGLGF